MRHATFRRRSPENIFKNEVVFCLYPREGKMPVDELQCSVLHTTAVEML